MLEMRSGKCPKRCLTNDLPARIILLMSAAEPYQCHLCICVFDVTLKISAMLTSRGKNCSNFGDGVTV